MAKEISCIDLIPTPNSGEGVVEIEVVEEIVGSFFMYVDLISTLKTVENSLFIENLEKPKTNFNQIN